MSERQLDEGAGAENHHQSSCSRIETQLLEDSCISRVSVGPVGFPEVIILRFTTIALNRLSLNSWWNLNYVV